MKNIVTLLSRLVSANEGWAFSLRTGDDWEKSWAQIRGPEGLVSAGCGVELDATGSTIEDAVDNLDLLCAKVMDA